MKGGDKKEASGPSQATTVKTPPAHVTGVKLNSGSAKKAYNQGDALDIGGLTLEVTKSDGSKETIAVTADMVSGFDGSKVGKQTLTVTYEGYANTYEVEVKATTPTTPTTPAPDEDNEDVVVPAPSVTAHVQRVGWMTPVTDGTVAGTTGKSRRMEALTLRLPDGVAGGIEYRAHVQRSGWEEAWATNGAQSGTTGKSRRVEAVQIQLTGEAKDAYDVYYRVHVQRIGWMAWAKNGEEAGTTGMSRRAEAIQVVLVRKDAPAPDATYKGATQQHAKAFVKK